MEREALLTRTFVQLADTLVDEFDVIDLLTVLTGRCVELLGATAAGLLVADREGRLRLTAASSERTRLLELFALQNEEGPCLDCYRMGRPVVNEDLALDSRWPRFAREALEAGFRSVHALPMRLREVVVGSLNLFMAGPGPFSEADVSVAQGLADVATIAILQSQAVRDAEALADQLQHALNSREAVAQATGVVAERAGIGVDEAFTWLRRYARDHGAQMGAVARALIAGALPPEALIRGPSLDQHEVWRDPSRTARRIHL
jgi:GAF domain-containing protein